MPEIPVYTSKGTFPAGNLQRIPQGIESGVSKVIEDAGSKVAYLGSAFNAAIEHAKEVAAMGTFKSRAMVELNDLSNKVVQSPEFFVDPQSARNQWKQQAEALKTNMMGGIHPDARLSREFDVTWQGLVAQHEIHLANEIKKKSVDQVVGANLRVIQNFSNSIGSAPNPEVALKALVSMQEQVNKGIGSGAFSYEQGQKLEEHYRNQALSAYAHNLMIAHPEEVVRQLQNAPVKGQRDTQPLWQLSDTHKANILSSATTKVERLRKEAEQKIFWDKTNYAANYLSGIYGLNGPDANLLGALDALNDRSKWPSLGLDGDDAPQVAENVSKTIQAKVAARQRAQSDADSAAVESFNQTALRGLKSGTLDEEMVLNATMPNGAPMDSRVKTLWLNALQNSGKGEYKDDPEFLSRALFKAITGQYKTVVDDELLQGVSERKLNPKTLDTTIRTAIANSQDPSKNLAIKDAIEAFDAQYGDTPSVKALKSRFISVLEEEIRRDNLTGSAITERAVQIMQDQEEYWFQKKWREWTTGVATGKGWGDKWEEMQKEARSNRLERQKAEKLRAIPGTPQGSGAAPVVPAESPPPASKPMLDPRVKQRVLEYESKGIAKSLIINGLRSQLGLSEEEAKRYLTE